MSKNPVIFLICLLLGFSSAHSNTPSDSTVKNESRASLPLSNGWSVGIGVGSLGAGITLNKTLNSKFSLSLGCYFFSYQYKTRTSVQAEQVSFNASLGSSTLPLLLAYYPFKRSFNVKVGVAYSSHTTKVEVLPMKNYSYGNLIFSPNEIGSISFDVNRANIQPYFGIGFGRSQPQKRVNFAFDLGCFYHGKPQIKLTATESLEPTANQSNQAILNNAFSKFTLYPFLNLSINIKIR